MHHKSSRKQSELILWMAHLCMWGEIVLLERVILLIMTKCCVKFPFGLGVFNTNDQTNKTMIKNQAEKNSSIRNNMKQICLEEWIKQLINTPVKGKSRFRFWMLNHYTSLSCMRDEELNERVNVSSQGFVLTRKSTGVSIMWTFDHMPLSKLSPTKRFHSCLHA